MGNQNSTSRAHVAVIGGGPAGLMAAEVLAGGGARVTLYERMPSAGRKFLLAGRGGLNLTHGEALDSLLERYGAAKPHLRAAIEAFSPADLRAWSEGLGQVTFVGSSGRIFPQALKASPLLRAWLRRLAAMGVRFEPRHRWVGWDAAGELIFDAPPGRVSVHADATVLALGGASWPRLGSDGGWVAAVIRGGHQCFAAGSPPIAGSSPRGRMSSAAASRASRSSASKCPLRATPSAARRSSRAMDSRAAPSTRCRRRCAPPIAAQGEAVIRIDLRPDIAAAALEQRLRAPRGKQSLATFLRKTLALAPVAVGLLNEAAMACRSVCPSSRRRRWPR